MLPHLIGRRGPGQYVPASPGGGGTGVSDGGFVEPPVVTTTAAGNTTINGKVKPGSFGKFVLPLATIAAGRQYTFRYTPQFAQLAQQGKLAMVGFGLKNGNDFHIVGLRGNGTTGLNKYKVNGTPPNGWNKDTGHTTSDGGAAANGTQAGPNYIRLVVSADGATYTFQTSSNGTAWSDEYTSQTPTPFSNVSGVATFGIALWFNNADAGPFSIVVDQFADTSVPITARYWREYFPSYNGNNAIWLAETELRVTAGGANQISGGTATASGYWAGDSSTYGGPKAVDGNAGTAWQSSADGVDNGAFWSYDFGSGVAKAAGQAALTAISTGGNTGYSPKSCFVAYSTDASTYTIAFGKTGMTSWSASEQRLVTDPALNAAAAHRYWAIVSLANGGTTIDWIASIEMRSTSGGSTLCTGGTPIGDGWGSSLANAFDGNGTTYADKVGGGSGIWWIGYDFGSAVGPIIEVLVKVRDSFSLPAPTRFGVMCSDDGVNWSTAWMVTATGWTNGQSRVFTKP